MRKDLRVIDAMATYGGSFVKALAEALRKADAVNFQKLVDTFPEYWHQYADMATVDELEGKKLREELR